MQDSEHNGEGNGDHGDDEEEQEEEENSEEEEMEDEELGEDGDQNMSGVNLIDVGPDLDVCQVNIAETLTPEFQTLMAVENQQPAQQNSKYLSTSQPTLSHNFFRNGANFSGLTSKFKLLFHYVKSTFGF